ISPEAQLRAWVNETMADTTAFFDAPRTSDYSFAEAPEDVRRKGEAGTLRFPSAFTTPHAENNIVVARWFPAGPLRGPRPTYAEQRSRHSTYVGRGTRNGPGRAVVVLPQWNADAEGHIGLSRLLAR